jgi:hypothetical protein
MISYLIDPEARSITEFEYDGSMQGIYETIDATMFDVVRLNEKGDVVYVDDEGLYNSNHFWRVANHPHPIAGKGMVLGTDSQGESQAPSATNLETLQASVLFISRAQAIERAEYLDAKNQEYMDEHPDGPVIFSARTSDIIKGNVSD